MPLYDWSNIDAGIFHDFHTVWIGQIRNALNEGLLPGDFYALAEQHAGQMIPDVLTLRTPPSPREPVPVEPPPVWSGSESGGVAVADAPPRVTTVETIDPVPRELRRTLTIRHVSTHRIVALLEIVSPSNKDRAEHIEQFAVKSANALEQGIHVLVIDLFAPGQFDPHGIHYEIQRQISPFAEPADDANRYCSTLVSYAADRPIRVYREHVALLAELPPMPLFLTPERYINVPLEATHALAWRGMPKFWRDIVEQDTRAAAGSSAGE